MSDESFRINPDHHDVFISYAQEDKPIADAVCAKLESRNIRCWIAPRDIPPGKSFPEAIIEGIEGGKVVVLIFSSSANKSPHVTRELTNAVNKGRIIIPFRIEDVLPSKSMEYLISVPHWLDAVSPPLEKHIDLLARTVGSIINPDRKPAPDLNAALVPEPPQVTESPPPAPSIPSKPAPASEREITHPETVPDHLAEPGSPPTFSPARYKKELAIAGIVIAGFILLFAGWQMGVFNFPVGLNTSDSIRPTTSAPIDYRASDAAVNTVVLTTEPTQTLARDTEPIRGCKQGQQQCHGDCPVQRRARDGPCKRQPGDPDEVGWNDHRGETQFRPAVVGSHAAGYTRNRPDPGRNHALFRGCQNHCG